MILITPLTDFFLCLFFFMTLIDCKFLIDYSFYLFVCFLMYMKTTNWLTGLFTWCRRRRMLSTHCVMNEKWMLSASPSAGTFHAIAYLVSFAKLQVSKLFCFVFRLEATLLRVFWFVCVQSYLQKQTWGRNKNPSLRSLRAVASHRTWKDGAKSASPIVTY